MFILLSNDDGYLAPGINALAAAIRDQASRLAIMAPDRNMSGASHSLTLTRPLCVRSHGADIYSVEGTPSDCVHLAVSGYFDYRPDIVLSGINQGANLGDDVMYSGTVAAAFEGRHLGLPAIAFSNTAANPQHYDASAHAAADLLTRLRRYHLPAGTLLNVNIPDLPYEQIRGYKTTVLGKRRPSQPPVAAHSPRGHTYYWIGASGSAHDPEPNSDFAAIEQGYISITPLMFDLTHHAQLDDICDWLNA